MIINKIMEIEKVNHKELVPLEHYLEQFALADPAQMARRTGTVYDAERKTFTVTFLGRQYEITWPDYQIRVLDQSDVYSPLLETNQSRIMMIRFLLEVTAVESTGKFLTYRDVPWGEVYYRQFNGRCMARLAYSFGNKLDQFREKMEKLGAEKVDGADAAYQYEIFPGYKVQFLLWEGDDEFPPSSQILFSDNFPASFHPEDLVVAAEIVVAALKKV